MTISAKTVQTKTTEQKREILIFGNFGKT